MVGHSRPKDGVLSHAYVPAISFRGARPCHPKRDARHEVGHDKLGAGSHNSISQNSATTSLPQV